MILVLVEHDGRRPGDTSLQALTLGREIAGTLDTTLEAILFGPGASGSAPALAGYGIARARVAEGDPFTAYSPDAWAAAIAELARAGGAAAVLATGSDRGMEVLARAAARLGQPMAANCTAVRPGDPFVVTRQRWGGSLLEEAEVAGSPVFLTVAPFAVAAAEAQPVADFAVEPFAPSIAAEDLRVRVVGRVEREPGTMSLADAKVVVGGGRGVGSAEGFTQLEELASLLGGTVGVSRVVTSAGWRPHTQQVGQTGTRIAPDLYVACGISGAIQHIVGCRAAKAILAINTDADAPMVERATYAVIGDLHAVVPAISAEIRRVTGQAAS